MAEEAEADVARADTFGDADSDECAGAGKCHGALKWCRECGDVAHTCDARLKGLPCDEHPVPPHWNELRASRATAEAELRRAKAAVRAAADLLTEIQDLEYARRVFDRQRTHQERELLDMLRDGFPGGAA